jgi:hypothetical protein
MDEMDDILTCPITMVVMREPVVADDGHTYERSAIAEWVKMKGTSPLTRGRMTSHFIPNIPIRKMIRTSSLLLFLKSHKRGERHSKVFVSTTMCDFRTSKGNQFPNEWVQQMRSFHVTDFNKTKSTHHNKKTRSVKSLCWCYF